MKNAVNSVENLIEVNTEPSLVGNYLEGVTTRVEPKVETMAIITHLMESNPIEKRSAPFVGDDIVWSARRRAELGRNDLTTFGEFNFNMAGTTIRNQVIKMISGFPITVKRNIAADVMNIQPLSELGFSQPTKLASVVISLTCLCRLLTPILTLISFAVSFIAPMVGITSKCSTSPNRAFLRTILAVSYGSRMGKGFATMRAYLFNLAFISWIVRTRINPTPKLQKTFTVTGFLGKRMFGHRLPADNASLEGQFGFAIASPRTVFIVLSGKFLATYQTQFHNLIIAQLDSLVNLLVDSESITKCINDDLAALKDTPMRFAKAARRAEEYFLTTLITDTNGPLDAVFSVARGGAAVAGNPLTIASLETGVEAMAGYTDQGSSPIMNKPKFLMIPPALEFTARQILTSANKMWLYGGDDEALYTGGPMPTKNVIAQYGLELLINPWIPIVAATATTNTQWYLFSSPADIPAIEFGHLRGHENPELFMKSSDQVTVGGGLTNPMGGDFATDNIFYKVRHCFGGVVLSGRAGYASDGV